VLNQLLSNRVEKTPSTDVSADRYEFLTLAEAEPDLGVPASNGYILSSTTTGTRSWINPATNLSAPGSDKQVVFNNGGVLSGATGLVYDTSTGRVGVGNTTLTQMLDIAGNATLRNSTTATNLYVHNTYTDASNYERAVIGWNSNVLQIGTEAAGTGTRRSINLNYSTTIDGNSRTNVPALTITNVGAGSGGILLGALQIGYQQDWSRLTALYTANKSLAYKHGGSAVASQGVHRFSSDTNGGTAVGANGSILDVLAPSTAANIFQLRQSDETLVFNVAYNGAITTSNVVTRSAEVTTLSTTVKTQVSSFAAASFRSGKLVVQAYDSVTGEVQISELLVVHNGAVASATEYGVVYTGSESIVTYDVDISAGNVRLMATRTTTNSTQYKVSETLMIA